MEKSFDEQGNIVEGKVFDHRSHTAEGLGGANVAGFIDPKTHTSGKRRQKHQQVSDQPIGGAGVGFDPSSKDVAILEAPRGVSRPQAMGNVTLSGREDLEMQAFKQRFEHEADTAPKGSDYLPEGAEMIIQRNSQDPANWRRPDWKQDSKGDR